MLHLLKIDLKKMTSYRTFWVVCGLYFLTLGFGAASGMEFLKWLANLFDNFGEKLNIDQNSPISFSGRLDESHLVWRIVESCIGHYGRDIHNK